MKVIKFLALALLSFSVYAWEPTKPVTVLIGQAPGAGNEVSFRAVSSIIEKQNPKINFVILNKPGADGNIAANMLTEAAPDGYTISVPSLQGQFVTAEIWHKEVIKYNPLDWELITVIAKSPLCLVARPNSTVNTVPEFLTAMKSSNRNINIAVGGGAHKVAHSYVMEKVKSDNAKVQTVMYKGPLQAVTGVASGDGKSIYTSGFQECIETFAPTFSHLDGVLCIFFFWALKYFVFKKFEAGLALNSTVTLPSLYFLSI